MNEQIKEELHNAIRNRHTITLTAQNGTCFSFMRDCITFENMLITGFTKTGKVVILDFTEVVTINSKQHTGAT